MKIDDVSNTGSIKLRVRSLVESLHISLQQAEERQVQKPFISPSFHQKGQKEEDYRPILHPFYITTYSFHF